MVSLFSTGLCLILFMFLTRDQTNVPVIRNGAYCIKSIFIYLFNLFCMVSTSKNAYSFTSGGPNIFARLKREHAQECLLIRNTVQYFQLDKA